MKKLSILFLVVSLSFIFAHIPDSVAQDNDLPTRAELTDGWNQIKTGGDTTCALGTPYSFYVHPADSEKLLIYFNGGGACWNGENCQPDGGTYNPSADTILEEAREGIFDLENPQNPVADYNMIVLPYCTGDVHTGSQTVTYETDSGESITIEHQGFTNATAVLEWVYANFENPDDIFITGCSAGSYGSIFLAPYIMQSYPDVPTRQLGDAGVGVLTEDWDGLALWGFYDNIPESFSDLQSFSPAEIINAYYKDSAAAYPENSFAQVTSARDLIQTTFHTFMGGRSWPTYSEELINDLVSDVANFDAYVYGGTQHCIIVQPTMYSYAANGVPFIDWFTDYVNGEVIDSVECETCLKAESSEP